MTPCGDCRRVVRNSERSCPFCGSRLSSAPAPTAVVALLGVIATGCPADDGDETGSAMGTSSTGAESSSGTAGSSGDDSLTGTGVTPGTSTMSSTSTSTETGDIPASSGSSAGFIYGTPDTEGEPIECSVFDQNCGLDEKCTAWANDGGDVWNATRCTGVDPDAVGLGEPCTVEGSEYSGIDNCDLGQVCFGVDEDTLTGQCTAYCNTRGDELSCDDAELSCMTFGSTMSVCVPAE